MIAGPAPLLIEPEEVEAIWGGDALVRRLGKRGDPRATIGESWECWDANRIASGAYAGDTIAQVRATLGPALVGPLDPTHPFPLLTKFIDAKRPLSVQVHPDDAYAQRVEGQPNGKTECWYILDAQPQAELILGWSRDLSREEYLTRVADGTLGDVLRRVPARRGDVFYLPAGTLHAIGAGILLYEVQQHSDLTYRIFDWNRLGPDGKPRTLHVDKAADVLNYNAGHGGALTTLPYALDGVTRTALVADANFTFERIELDAQRRALDLEGMPLVITALDQAVNLESAGAGVALAAYTTALIPAAAGSCTLSAPSGDAAVLTAAPAPDSLVLRRRYQRAGVSPASCDAFFAQFARSG